MLQAPQKTDISKPIRPNVVKPLQSEGICKTAVFIYIIALDMFPFIRAQVYQTTRDTQESISIVTIVSQREFACSKLVLSACLHGTFKRSAFQSRCPGDGGF